VSAAATVRQAGRRVGGAEAGELRVEPGPEPGTLVVRAPGARGLRFHTTSAAGPSQTVLPAGVVLAALPQGDVMDRLTAVAAPGVAMERGGEARDGLEQELEFNGSRAV